MSQCPYCCHEFAPRAGGWTATYLCEACEARVCRQYESIRRYVAGRYAEGHGVGSQPAPCHRDGDYAVPQSTGVNPAESRAVIRGWGKYAYLFNQAHQALPPDQFAALLVQIVALPNLYMRNWPQVAAATSLILNGTKNRTVRHLTD